jgi:hypothetical protein
VSLTALVPSNAIATRLSALLRGNGDVDGIQTGEIRLVSGSTYHILGSEGSPGGGLAARETTNLTVPNISQQVFYLVAGGTAPLLSLWVNGFIVPNGGE